MKIKSYNKFRLIFLIAACLIWAADAKASADERLFHAAVVISGNIKPYIEAMAGLTETLHDRGGVRIERFILEEFSDKQKEVFKQQISEKQFDLYIAVGPEAAQFCQSELPPPRTPVIRTMILRPEQKPENVCGVFLNIPVVVQLQEIITAFPGILKIGLLHDPKYNRSFFEKAAEAAQKFDIEIIPLEAGSKKDIPVVLKQNWNNVDIIWLIPDRTVISESIIQYIIKESLLKKIPVIGFNRFFYESGAALSFVFNYRKLGSQTGDLALKVLSGHSCDAAPPVFEALINEKVRNRFLKK